jgi:hypothetical protein
MLLRYSVGQFSEVVRETEVVAAFGSSPPQALQLAHGPARDVVAAGAVAEEARQDVEVASSSKPIVVFPVCAPNVPQLTRE